MFDLTQLRLDKKENNMLVRVARYSLSKKMNTLDKKGKREDALLATLKEMYTIKLSDLIKG